MTFASHEVGTGNTAIGDSAGLNFTGGSYNIAIGANTTLPSENADYQLSIGNWIYGSGGNISIGQTGSFVDKLTVAGT